MTHQTTHAPRTWMEEEDYWRSNYSTRPYASSGSYETFAPGYRYGYDAANRYSGRSWDEVESDLQRDWDAYEYRSTSTWQQIKGAVRDAWDRITGRV
jgi:hypothetical protein